MARRTRIGVFVNDLLSPYQIRLFNSIKRAANTKGIGVIGFQGSFLVQHNSEQRTAFDGSFIYGLAGEESVDGLIIVSNALSSRAGIEAVHRLCRESSLPIVSIGRLSNIHSIATYANEALSELVEHLVTDHMRSKIALIEGPSENPDSLERGKIVRETLDRLNVPLLESHIVQGDFLEASGASAIRILFDRRGLNSSDIDAIIALNDQMAAGVLYELAARGISVPNEISVIGFDDDDFARSANPPLTTVSQPIELMGERAIQAVTALIDKKATNEYVLLDAEPVWRRSCGCEVPQASRYVSVIPQDITSNAIEASKEHCYERYNNLAGLFADAHTIETALAVVETPDSVEVTRLLQELEEDVFRAYKNGMDPLRWHDILSPLSNLIERGLPVDRESGRRRERRMRAVSLIINEVAARVRALDQLHTMQWAHAARVLGSALLSVRHIQYLDSVLSAGLPGLGIRYCCVCLFVGNAEFREAVVAALYSPDLPPPVESPLTPEQLWLAAPGSIPPEASAATPRTTVFPASELVHPRLHNSIADTLDLSVYPLVYAHETLGYVVFDAPADAHRSWLLEGLAGSLSSAVYATKRNAELREARDKAERANAAKSEFVAMITHEVRTPLTAVIGHLDLCLQTELSEVQSRHVKQSLASSNALLSIVNDILDFSKIEAQRIELESIPFALDEVLDQAMGACIQTAVRKGLRLIVDAEPSIPHWIKGDPLRLNQVLLNLMSNAVKFSSNGDVLLNVYRLPTDSIVDVPLKFVVEDKGIGMKPEVIDRIFEPFTQGDGSMTRKYGGTGLGLTISQQLVRLMNGNISVTSQPGEGSQFEFTACFKRCEYPIEDLVQGKGKHVLLATSSKALKQSLKNLLLSYEFGVTCVSTETDCLDKLKKSGVAEVNFDLLIWDDNLTVLNILASIHRITPLLIASRTKVLVLSESVDEVTKKDKAQIPNLSAVIRKPFQRRHLSQVIAHALSRPHSCDAANPLNETLYHLPSNTRILAVQDNPVSCDVIYEMLINAGAKVKMVTTGNLAVECVKKEVFDIIIMDLCLPDIDGFEVTKRIRALQNGEKVPILALSASTLRDSLSKCLASGMNDFIEAPVDSQTLIQTISRWIGDRFLQKRSDNSFQNFCKPYLSNECASSLSDELIDLDISQALSRLDGNQKLYNKILKRFVESAETEVLELRKAFDALDLQRAGLIAHTLSSTAGNIGATKLYEATRSFEIGVKKEEPFVFLDQYLNSIDCAVKQTLCIAAKYLTTENIDDSIQIQAANPDWNTAAERLRQYIDSHDSAALDYLQQLQEALGPNISSGKTFQRLSVEVSSYDFEKARFYLDSLVEELKNTKQASDGD